VTSDRKAAIAAYKERKTIAGIFVIRSKASKSRHRRLQGAEDHRGDFRDPQQGLGRAMGRSGPDLEKIQNRIWFTLRQGSHTCRSLQAAWTTHGPDNLTFGECERLEEEETSYIRDALLKERLKHWRTQLGAEAV
jgi:hypothetical protein